MIVAVGHDGSHPELVAVPGRDELHLAHREAELVERTDTLVDAVALARCDRLLARDLLPQAVVTVADDGSGLLHTERAWQLDLRAQVGELAGHILHHDDEVL